MPINTITHINDISNKAQTGNVKQFNAALPIAIEVLEKISPTRYMLKIGNTTMITKSMAELIVGGKYWAQMSKAIDGSIALSQLIAQPRILAQIANAPMKLNQTELKELFSSEKTTNPWENFKSQLIERASMAESRTEFNFYMQMLLSMHNKVLTVPLQIGERESVLQLRKKRKQGLYELEFYTVFGRLGALRGKLTSDEEDVNLYIATQYEKSAILLDSTYNLLKGISHFSIEVKPDIMPLYEFKDINDVSLIDMKG